MPAPKEVAKLINPFFKALGSAEELWQTADKIWVIER
jgi:hypothetical protein